MQKVKGVYLCCEVTLELENRREYDGNSLLSKFESFKIAWLLNKHIKRCWLNSSPLSWTLSNFSPCDQINHSEIKPSEI